RDTLVVDDVTRDNISRLWPFHVDLPNGKYRVSVLTGAFNKPGANRPDSHFRQYSISANGVELYRQDGTVEEFYHPDGRYFHSYYRDWHPDVNLYSAVIAPWIPMREKEVQVTDGKLVIQATSYAAINALFVFPADNPKGRSAIDAFRKGQEAFFNEQFKYLPSSVEHPMPALPEQIVESGAVMFVRDEALSLRTGTRPTPRDFGRPLRLFASIGEREAGTIAVTPLKDVSGPIKLTATDLTGDGNAIISGAAFDIRYIRYGEYPVQGGYGVRPFFLMPWMPGRWEKELTRGFWVDLHVPEDAKPGFYSGQLKLEADGLDASLPVQLRVLPLRLPVARVRAGVYAGNLGGTTFRPFRTARMLPRELMRKVLRTRMQFFADQGFTGLYDSLPWWPLELKDGEVVPTDAWEIWKESFETSKSIPNFSDRIFHYYCGGPQIFPKCDGFLHRGSIHKMKMEDIKFTDRAIEQMSKMVQWLYREMRANGYPELVFYVQDELGNHGTKGARYGRELLKALNKIRKQVPGGFRTCISTLRVSIAREYLSEADIVLPNSAYPVTKETIAELRAKGATLGLYNMGSSRFSYGFYPWRVDAFTRAQWSFSYDGDSGDPFVALPVGRRVSCDSHFTPDWEILPSIGMLALREGVDDFRYVQLLEEKLAAAKKAGRKSDVVKRASAIMDELKAAVSEDYLSPTNNWDKSTLDYWRWRVAEAAIGLE
ncbi:MAG: hypothetical protein QF473_25025, partial [Planctomycetota bacterium]|nr:hypothetical protein [Planctomycetota bacterium]